MSEKRRHSNLQFPTNQEQHMTSKLFKVESNLFSKTLYDSICININTVAIGLSFFFSFFGGGGGGGEQPKASLLAVTFLDYWEPKSKLYSFMQVHNKVQILMNLSNV